MSFEDERIRFYFRHRDQIEQWAALRGEAAIAVDDWLLGLRPHIEALASELGADVVVRCLDASDFAWPGFRLSRKGWNVLGEGDRQPSVSLEWARGRTTLRGNAAPYVGVRAPREDACGGELRAREAFKQARIARKDLQGPWWAAYAFRLPSSPFPDEEDAYRSELLGALRAAWDTYSEIIDTLTPNP